MRMGQWHNNGDITMTIMWLCQPFLEQWIGWATATNRLLANWFGDIYICVPLYLGNANKNVGHSRTM